MTPRCASSTLAETWRGPQRYGELAPAGASPGAWLIAWDAGDGNGHRSREPRQSAHHPIQLQRGRPPHACHLHEVRETRPCRPLPGQRLKLCFAFFLPCSLVFSVGNREIDNFRMIERHYFRNRLVKSYDFTFGFCIPGSTNEWEAVYAVPGLDEDLSKCLGRFEEGLEPVPASNVVPSPARQSKT
eukprot:scaffold48_cov311-Pinguiococcus_pyrenoidosus.AAC.287